MYGLNIYKEKSRLQNYTLVAGFWVFELDVCPSRCNFGINTGSKNLPKSYLRIHSIF